MTALAAADGCWESGILAALTVAYRGKVYGYLRVFVMCQRREGHMQQFVYDIRKALSDSANPFWDLKDPGFPLEAD